MDNQRDPAWADALLRRPAVDPGIPGPERALLIAPGTLLTPACHARPAWSRDYLPTDPDKRGTTIDGAVMGMTAAAFIAVGAATPLAVGTLIFSHPVGWQAASGRYGLLLAEILAIITAVVFVTRIVRFGHPGGRAPAAMAARAYHGRYLTVADFDAQSRVLLRRAQDAVDSVTSAEIYQAGLLDVPAISLALAGQEWDIALALREQARLRARRAEVPADGAGPRTAAVLDDQVQAARIADASIAARVAALEGYTAEVRKADAAYRDWRQAAALAEVSLQHLDMLARTAADEHGIAEIDTLSRQAGAVRRAFREPPG